MTQKVSDEKLGEFARQQWDWFRRVREGSLDPDEIAQAVQALIDRPTLFKRDMRKEAGWTLEKEGPAHPASLTKPSDLELVTFLNYDEHSIVGAELEIRAAKLGANLGQHTAEWLLDHQSEIPEEWRRNYLVFTSSVWQSSYGDRRAPCLCWDGGRWCLDFGWLGIGFFSDGRLVRFRPST